LRKHRALATTAIGIAALLTSAVAVAGPAVATPAHGAGQAAAAAPAVVVTTTTSKFGRVLVTGSGRSLYVFTGDNFPFSAKSAVQLPCTALNKGPGKFPCTAAWPPLLATGPLVARGGVRQAGLGTVTRNHVKQVTYFGHPLYRFVGDAASGQKNGQNFAAFDGMWYLDVTAGRPAIGVSTLQTERSANGVVLASPTATPGRRTLYTLSFDGPRMTTCTGACSALWPPLLTSGRAKAGAGVSRSAIGTIRRANGSLQVTYHGHPVYMFAFDLGAGAKPGLTNGEYLVDAAASGVWYTVLPNGRPDPGTTTVRSHASSDGKILSVTGGFNHVRATLYGFTPDTARVSKCNGQCAIFWPPVLTKGRPKAGAGVSQSHLGTLRRSDGTVQVTYFGHPLYFFAQALNSGLGGDAFPAFGGIFYAVTVNGALV
jgi:predicted lipoprotein with Yx(FWY)xxD motif